MRKVCSIMLTLVFVLSFALTVQARPEINTPESYDFRMVMEMDIDWADELPDDANIVLAMVGGLPLRLVMTGSAVSENELSAKMQFDINLVGSIIADPIRAWVNVDLNDVDAPVFDTIIELPPLFRAMLGAADPMFRRQFMVMDLSEFMYDIDPAYLLDATNMAEEFMAMFNFSGNRFYLNDLDAFFGLASEFDEISGFDEFDEFEFSFTVNDDGYVVNMAIVIAMPIDDETSSSISVEMEISNINNATVAPFPAITAENSIDLMEVF